MLMASIALDVLWGWDTIAGALGVDIKTAQRLAQEEGLPVYSKRGQRAQSTIAELQRWANRRARRGRVTT